MVAKGRCFCCAGFPVVGDWEAIDLDSLPAEERERILRDLFGEAENDCE
jgi:hypothetical protein